MNLNPIKANMTELDINGMKVLFSYRTPVAVRYIDGRAFKTDKKWNNTTTRHINQWLDGRACAHETQKFFDNLVAEVK
jgi:hypothetical protein